MIREKKSEIGLQSGEETPVSTGTVKETYNVDIATAADHALQHMLKPRHMQINTIGGVIGMGLFLGTGSNLDNGGQVFSLATASWPPYSSQSWLPWVKWCRNFLYLADNLRLLIASFLVSLALQWEFYTSTIVLPAEISAAVVLVPYWTPAGDANSTCTVGICNNALTRIELDEVGSQCGWGTILRRDGVLVLLNQGKYSQVPVGAFLSLAEVLRIMNQLGSDTGMKLEDLYNTKKLVDMNFVTGSSMDIPEEATPQTFWKRITERI